MRRFLASSEVNKTLDFIGCNWVLEAEVGIGQEMVLAVPTTRPTTTYAISDPSPDRQRNRL